MELLVKYQNLHQEFSITIQFKKADQNQRYRMYCCRSLKPQISLIEKCLGVHSVKRCGTQPFIIPNIYNFVIPSLELYKWRTSLKMFRGIDLSLKKTTFKWTMIRVDNANHEWGECMRVNFSISSFPSSYL